MEKNKDVVCDAGPFIHLHEVQQLSLVKQFSHIYSTQQILEECIKIKKEIEKQRNVVIKQLNPASKDFSSYLIQRYDLDLGEATAIALCKQKAISLFFTDDLLARDTAIQLGFDAHGTIALVLRALRRKMLSKNEALMIIERLYNDSTLYFSKTLLEFVQNEVKKYKE